MNASKRLKRFACALAAALVCASAVPTHAATVKKADDTTVAGPLVALENGAVVLNVDAGGKPQRTAIPLEDIVEVTIDPAADAPAGSTTSGSPKPGETTVAPSANANYISLFDGKSLNNWAGEQDVWSVRDGVIVGAVTDATVSNKVTFLTYTGGEFDDFELRYQFKISGGRPNSSGIQFRSKIWEHDGLKEVNGYQQDLGMPAGLCGGIVDSGNNANGQSVKAAVGERATYTTGGERQVAALPKSAQDLNALVKTSDWNEAVLIAKGNRLVSIINGEIFAEAINDSGVGAKSGLLAFQLSRRGDITLEVKELRLRKLGPTDDPLARGMMWDRAKSEINAAQSKSARPSTAPEAVASTAPTTQPAVQATAQQTNWQVRLVGGDQITGELLAWDDRQVMLKTAHGTLAMPVKQIRELWHASVEEIAKARAARSTAAAAAATEDVAFARKDDQVIPVGGLALGADAGSLRFRFRDQERKILFDKLVGVTLAAAEEAAPDESLQQTLVLKSGDIVSGKWTALDRGSITLSAPWGAALNVPLGDVERVRTKNGRLVYVSDLAPAQVEQTPYFDRLLPYRVDKSLTGGPIKLSTGDVARGLSVHSRTVLRYDIGRRFQTFRTKLGFQQPEGKLGRARIRVIGDDKVLYEIADARGDQPPVDLDLPVEGVSRLTLEVDFGADQDVGDRVVWADARLLRAAGSL